LVTRAQKYRAYNISSTVKQISIQVGDGAFVVLRSPVNAAEILTLSIPTVANAFTLMLVIHTKRRARQNYI
jgi:hypothetical protein